MSASPSADSLARFTDLPGIDLRPRSPLRGETPSRLMAAVEGALARPGHGEHRMAGRVVLTPDGRPIRSVLTGRKRHMTGSYVSRKAGRGQVFESHNELAFYQECEVDPRVVDYRAQPFRFEFVLEGQLRRYIPDCVRLLDTGRIEIVEVKADSRYLADADYCGKLNQVGKICALIGWTFALAVGERIHSPRVRRENIKLIQQDRMVLFDEQHVYRVRSALAERGGEGAFGEIAAAIEPPPLGEAILRGLMVARLVQIDLDSPLTSRSRVRPWSGLVEGRC